MSNTRKWMLDPDLKTIRDKEWEIVTVRNDAVGVVLFSGFYKNTLEEILKSFQINSVRRLSDNKVFSVGDEVKWVHHSPFKISSFKIGLKNEMFAVDETDEGFSYDILKLDKPIANVGDSRRGFFLRLSVSLYLGSPRYLFLHVR
mgnify:CR=1 FL=1